MDTEKKVALLRTAVLAVIHVWEAQRLIEHVVGRDLDDLANYLDNLAIGVNGAKDVSWIGEDDWNFIEEQLK